VEQHGINPVQKVIAVIPARFSSTRLRGKLLLEIGGLPLIVRTLKQVKKARNIDRVIVATDDERILSVVSEYGGEAVMTAADHQSGSDRIAEVARKLLASGSIIVNVQGDEPLISPRTIEAAVEAMIADASLDIVTTCEPVLSAGDVLSPNVVKVVVDGLGGALYFSRSPIPFPREAVSRYGSIEAALVGDPSLLSNFRKHTGLYVYRREYLLRFATLPQSPLEISEMLEQLRALEDGARIRVVEVPEPSVGVDTAEDLERARELIANNE
jgi:3-deoxy-manno-octulosonate cytidylyltransferase (CMP-KDO synthetase)